MLEELAAKGVRLTSQRRVLVDIIQNATEHLDAAGLLAQAQEKESSVDRATVYRTLDLLKRHRLIDELDLLRLKGERHFYEVKTRRDHVHLACSECGGVEELSTLAFEELKAEIAQLAGFEVRAARLEIGGICRSCKYRSREGIDVRPQPAKKSPHGVTDVVP